MVSGWTLVSFNSALKLPSKQSSVLIIAGVCRVHYTEQQSAFYYQTLQLSCWGLLDILCTDGVQVSMNRDVESSE